MLRSVFFLFYLGILAACGPTEQAEQPKALNPASAALPEPPIATTQYGQVRGFVEDDVLVFKGIRYGADTATTRFQPPVPPAHWEGVKDALAYGNSTRQMQRSSSISLFESWQPDPAPELSEDCLFLNVWTPALADGGKRPVMVWFHGGGFSTGSGSSNAYDGVRLTNRGDVVVVTVNHRLNIFAHLYLAEYGDQFANSGNTGILDLVQSLEWVRDNIEAFGGDPDNVLIFGESGGGSKVSVLMALDQAEGLFHRAVVQSGPRLTNREPAEAAVGTDLVVEQLGLDQGTIENILTTPPEQIEEAARQVVVDGGRNSWNGPVFDGTTFKRQPFQPDAPAQSSNVPLLIGTTRTEMSLLAGARRPELFDLTWESLPAAMLRALPDADITGVIQGYRSLDPTLTAPMLFFEAITDNGFLRRSIELADQKARQDAAPVYFYYFNWDSPVEGGKWAATHALDIGFVFDNVANSASMSGVGEAQQNIADMMAESWLAFARIGDPNNAQLPEWEPYSVVNKQMMVINNSPALIDHPRRAFLDLLN